MGDYEQSRRVDAPADELFAYLADVRNLPKYFSAMTGAEPADGEAVRVTAEVDGNRHEAEAWFRVDRERRHLEWGSEGDNDYHGRLDVIALDAGSAGSIVTVTLHSNAGENSRIDQGLSDTLGEIARLVEAGPARSAATV